MDAFDVIRNDARVDELARRLADGGGPVAAEGLWGSCAPILAAMAAEKAGRMLLIVTAHSDEADDFRDDIETAIGVTPALFPALETLPGEEGADDELEAERLRLCMVLGEREGEGSRDQGIEGSRAEGDRGGSPRGVEGSRDRGIEGSRLAAAGPRVIVAPIQALMQAVPTRAAIEARSRRIAKGMTVAVEEMAGWLEQAGFTRCEQVETPGDFAIRGGIIDIYSHAHMDPVRIELFGDDVESIRLFDAGTQRSAKAVEAVRVPAIGAGMANSEYRITNGGASNESRVASSVASSDLGVASEAGEAVLGDEESEPRPEGRGFGEGERNSSPKPLSSGRGSENQPLPSGRGSEDQPPPTGRGADGRAGIAAAAKIQNPKSNIGPTARDASAIHETTGFLAYLPPDAIVAFNEPLEIQEIGRSYWQRLGEPAGMIPVDAIFRRADDFSPLYLQRFVGATVSDATRSRRAIAFDVGSLPQFEAKTENSLAALRELAAENDIFVLCDNEPERERFAELLAQAVAAAAAAAEAKTQPPATNAESRTPQSEPRPAGRGLGERECKSSPKPLPSGRGSEDQPLPSGRGSDARSKIHHPKSKIAAIVGVMHRGFRWTRPLPAGRGSERLNRADRGLEKPLTSVRGSDGRPVAFVPHHELFGRYRQRRTLRKIQPARPIDSFFDLNPGDHVVHVMHGIGKFVGLTSIDKGDRREEYLAIQFAGEATVHVPVSQIDLVQKYVGAFRGKPKLSKLGGTGWKKTKERVAEAVGDLAADLLAVQARRAIEAGVAYPRDTKWQDEFEGSFLYEETPDQLRAIDEIKGDLTRPRPMDRLLCGDVGFGKTELAMRAAFKVVEYGRQVAVLVPTTVLAEQHFTTFRERMADYPFKVEVLSRFRTLGEQKKIVEAAHKGQVDVVIGTHRLLSKDVRFADLGLVVIDEEQRFGVEAKERLKHMRATVDVLTMTATPIPRTLHMAMLGVKDISSLATPPLDRRAIVTQVRTFEERLVREAIIRELNRDGQVYFVHNFVRDIHNVANHIRAIVPEARVVVGHGQMNEHELEDVMYRFMRREADVLVSTSIIESGLDIPAANTIFIHRPERFGLADLHQLRGRVGRSKHRAYAYLLLSARHPVLPNAAKRLKAIEHYSHVGAGFQIAMRDLEIRGAGNILGPEQSGHIEAVGYEMYCQLLENAVRRMKKEPLAEPVRVNLDLGIAANVPKAYIRGERQRLEVYKRLTTCRTPAEIEALAQDLRDAFGPPPPIVQTLLDLAEIRVLAGQWGIKSAVLVPPDVVFSVEDLSRVQPLFASGPGSPRVPDPRTIHWRLPERYLEKATLIAVLRKQLVGRAAASETTKDSKSTKRRNQSTVT